MARPRGRMAGPLRTLEDLRKARGNSRGIAAWRLERTRSAAGALLGFAVALVVVPNLPRRPAPHQLPGYAREHGFDPRADVLHLLLFAALPALGGLAALCVFRSSRFRWPSSALAALPHSESAAPETRRPRGAVATADVFAASLAHALILWTFLVGPLASRGVQPLTLLAGLVVLSLTLATALGGGVSGRGAAFLAAACPVLPLAFLGRRSNALSVAAAAAALALPFLAAGMAAHSPGLVRMLRGLAVWALLPGSVTALAAAAVLHAPPVADVFEDGHALLPASEYLRGALPYRDVVPSHGLLADGGLQSASLRLFGDDYRGLRRGEKVFGLLFWPAFYGLGAAATGSPALGFSTMAISFLCFPQYAFPRAMASLWTLALALYASRSKSRWAWRACGAAVPLNFCVALDFAAYAAAASLVALWVARGRRSSHLRSWLAGALVSSGAIALTFAAFGFLGDFVRTAFLSAPSLLQAYGLGFAPIARAAASFRTILEDRSVLLYAFAIVAVLGLGALLPRAPRVGSRARAMLPVLAWLVLAMLSVLERQHVGYPFFVLPAALVLAGRWFVGRRPWTSPRVAAVAIAAASLTVLWRPRLLVALIADAIANARPVQNAIPLSDPPRANGAVFRPGDVDLIRATREMMRRAHFRPADTWFDFADAPGLYYLFDRRCPVRYAEAPFYETEDGQREVVRALSIRQDVRTALVSHDWTIDGIPSPVRAPLVAEYLRTHFHPFYKAGTIEFWLRSDGESDRRASR